jgi:hypothetical protein
VEDDSLKRVVGDGSCKLFNIAAVLAIAVRNHPSQIRGKVVQSFFKIRKASTLFAVYRSLLSPKKKARCIAEAFSGKIIEITLFL